MRHVAFAWHAVRIDGSPVAMPLLVLVLLVHGSVHAAGFARAFDLVEIPVGPISRGWGVLWGACAVLLIASAAFRAAGVASWWVVAVGGLVVSQLLIVVFWADARFGTLVNLALAVPVVLAFGAWRFERRTEAEVAQLNDRAPAGPGSVVTASELTALPAPVAKWLRRAGAVGRPRTRTVTVAQRGEMQTSADSAWMTFQASQWVLVDAPAFLWIAHVEGPSGMSFAGRDRYVDGRGSMRIELLSIVPVVDRSGPTIDQGALVRFLAESMWYPSAALAPYVLWESIDELAARARVTVADLSADGVFSFSADGDVLRFEARRYRDDTLEDWIVVNDPASFRTLDGVRVPTRSTISWRNGSGEVWTWLRMEVLAASRNAELQRRVKSMSSP